MIRPAPNSSVPAAPEISAAYPVSPEEAARLLAPLERFSSLALAVSGGGDSLALLYLTAAWANARRAAGLPVPDLYVLTVDHGLRPEAAEEVGNVAQTSARLGIPARILTWAPPQGLTNLQQEARLARYRLISDAMDLSGIEGLVLAHQQDDQIETFLDRLTRGSGVYGLSAMAADQPDGPFGLRLLRPFLSVPGARLRATLAAQGVQWAEDPSNQKTAYKRVRLRRMAPGLAAEGLDAARILATIRRMARTGAAIDEMADGLLAGAFFPGLPDLARPDWAGVMAAPEEVRLRLLARLMQHVGGGATPPRLERLEALEQRLAAGQPLRATLAGAVVDLSASGTLRLWPEPGRNPVPHMTLQPGECGMWDGRYRLCLKDGAGGSLTVFPVEGLAADSPLRERARELARSSGFPVSALARLPVLCREAGHGHGAWLLPDFPPEPGVILRHTGVLRSRVSQVRGEGKHFDV